MATNITKRFSTIETVLGLMRFRDIMFRVIEAADNHRGNAIPEIEYLRFVAEYQSGQSKEIVSEIALLFDCENLLQSKILNDKKSAGGVTKLWFNTSIIDVFRLCKISLYRPLTRISLNASMTPIWSIVKDIEKQKISITPGTEEYDDWTGEVCHRTTELLGKISANISKLERVGEMFEKELQKEGNEQSLEITKVKFQEATRLYRREIVPLSDFLDKNTRYEQGDGIIITLEKLQALFRSFGDLESQGLMVRYQLQYLDMFKPIKNVADNVSVYLRKTKAAIVEHNAIESAFTVLRQAYEKTLSGDKRNKYINVGDLSPLGECHPIKSISRTPSFRVEKTPAFLNNVFNELASRNTKLNESVEKTFLFEENISRGRANKLKHSIKLSKWVESYEWPYGTDYLIVAQATLQADWPEFTIPDLLEIGSKLHTSNRYQVILTNEFKTIEDEKFKLRYRSRYLIPNQKKSKAA
ncbi:MAG: hypothetical protein ACI9JN_002812 [Bacteroidia bacterium]|jgi:hypothetical protein